MVPAGGEHILIDLWGVNSELLSNVELISDILTGGAEKSGATILSKHFHHFGGDYGVTGVLVLSESHISIHTWPETNYCAIDIFMCGNANPNIACGIIIEKFKPSIINVNTHFRGKLDE